MDMTVRPSYLTISLMLFLCSLFFDALELNTGSAFSAMHLLIAGWWGVIFELYGWFANPLFGLALLFRRRWPWLALVIALAAWGLAFSCLWISRVPDNHSYDFARVAGFGWGYYLWFAALTVFAAGQGWHCWQRRQGIEIPRWRMLDWLLLIALNATVLWASGNLGPLHQVKVERQTVADEADVLPQRLAEVPH
ncbi:hypothetical protein GCM10009504_21710 [Pseudomonas laurentiana]|nr:hypothetical protein GCM10009504_21710 [Pseudomonas laurentiana]